MTKQEAAIVMAYTGVSMLAGNDFVIFGEYCEKLLGHSIWTHEYPHYAETIKEKSKPDFIKLCQGLTENLSKDTVAADTAPVVHGHWIRYEDNYNMRHWYECSACEKALKDFQEKSDFCPHCGAEMDERFVRIAVRKWPKDLSALWRKNGRKRGKRQ